MKHVQWILTIAIVALAVGCASTSTEWGSGEVAGVGSYPPPGPGFEKKRMAVLHFEDKTGGGKKRADAASDQMTTLWVKTLRFRMVERERMQDLLKEQQLVGVVNPEQLVQAGKILGVELLCYGSITDFEIKKTNTESGGGILRGVGGIVGAPEIGVLDIDFRKAQLDFHIGVDVRIVDATTGEILFAESADMRRTETASGMGLSLAGLNVSSNGQIEISNENQGRLLRLSLDTVVKKLLPTIDAQYEK